MLGVWASTSMRKTRVLNESPTGPETMTEPPAPTDPWVQVSRLGMPNTNRLHIGLRSKDLFNARHPSTDPAEIAAALEWSALAEFWGWPSANRQDLVDLRLHGLPGVNQNGGVGDMLRIDTNVPPTPPAQQDRLGLLGSPPDPAGFPNGRRPGDDVVDIELKYLQGVLIGEPGPFDATDGADTDPTRYVSFPFLHVPFSRDDETLCVILTSSTSPDPSSFTTVQEAYVDSTDPNRIGTPMTADPLVFYLLDTEVDAFIQSVERNASVLEFVVGPGGSS